jgi:hypothetical protein
MRAVRLLKRYQAARLFEKHHRLGLSFALPKRQELLSVKALQFVDYKHARHKTHC